ncbi:hypothetical protein KY343_00035 [Candidatus Woesearchaeota archaeon]|nr:hypothetical protein [Candidatus Woesearchaeota archaeon]
METNINKFEDKYNKLKSKYDLPSIKELNDQFEIYDIIKEKNLSPSFPLRYTRRLMVSLFYGWINYLHNFIMPNPQSAILVRESEAFNEEQKNKVTKLIKEIMFINRLSTKLDLENYEQKDAEFIKKYFTEWKKIKKMILELANINLESWQSDMPSDKGSYFG